MPAQREDDRFTSQTPCHLRTVTVQPQVFEKDAHVQCPVCGRAWTVRYRPDATPPTARWTA